MKAKIFLATLLALVPAMANSAVQYRVEQLYIPPEEIQTPTGLDSEALARERRFYVGGAYNYAIWGDYTDDTGVYANGKNSSGFELYAGVRVYDTFRIEAEYIRTKARYTHLSLTSDMAMANAIFDARIDNIYRLFRTQKLVPYIGLGAGASWNSSDMHFDNKITPVLAGLAGLGIELGTRFAVDLGYRYLYIFSPKFEYISDLAPTAHQFRVGARVSF